VTCAVFATATGIVGAVVTLMGLLALPAMLKAGYGTQLSAGAITAGGALGIIIPPSVLLIVYGATAGVSVVKLYAGAFFPGLLLAALYVVYVIVVAKLKPHLAPPLSAEDRKVALPSYAVSIQNAGGSRAVPGLLAAIKGKRNVGVPSRTLMSQLLIALLPAFAFVALMAAVYPIVTAPEEAKTELVEMGTESTAVADSNTDGGLAEPGTDGGLAEPVAEGSLAEPSASGGLAEPTPPDAASQAAPGPTPQGAAAASATPAAPAAPSPAQQAAKPAPQGYWVALAIGLAALVAFYAIFTFARLEVFKMLLGSLFPLMFLILAVLGSIVFGLATPTEAAAMGALGALFLAAAYRRLNFGMVRESVYLTAKTSAMVCWLFVGSSIFSAAFALLGGQEIINTWVLSMDLTPLQFMILAQVVIFLLGWPLEWTEIIVIFMPIFVPLLAHYNIDPLFFGLLVAMNLQTAFLSPPVAMSAFYLKGVSPPHVTLNQIFLGMMPFMGIQIIALILLYMFPAIGMWLPEMLYK
jgi:TRAP-type mannitol/chloroaromatic compound transport system permease large subunit